MVDSCCFPFPVDTLGFFQGTRRFLFEGWLGKCSLWDPYTSWNWCDLYREWLQQRLDWARILAFSIKYIDCCFFCSNKFTDHWDTWRVCSCPFWLSLCALAAYAVSGLSCNAPYHIGFRISAALLSMEPLGTSSYNNYCFGSNKPALYTLDAALIFSEYTQRAWWKCFSWWL